MVHMVIEKNEFVRNYLIMFKPSSKSKKAALIASVFSLALIIGLVLIKQYIAAILIIVRAVKLIDDRYIRNSKHALMEYNNNYGLVNGMEIEILEENLAILVNGCSYLLSWDTFIKAKRTENMVYLEHRFGGQYYLFISKLPTRQKEILEEKIERKKWDS